MPHGRKRSYMKKSEETLEDFAISYPLDKLAPVSYTHLTLPTILLV